MALGKVTIFQNKENWLNSDIVIYANSSVRPRATMGGVVNTPTNDVISTTKVITDTFLPGQIRMGPAWDPYGENRAELTRDWQRALAHEFGHYLLYLPDNYLGYDKNGVIKTVDCRGSFMTNSSDSEYAKYLNTEEWRNPANNCGSTIAARLDRPKRLGDHHQVLPLGTPGRRPTGTGRPPVGRHRGQRYPACHPTHRVARSLL